MLAICIFSTPNLLGFPALEKGESESKKGEWKSKKGKKKLVFASYFRPVFVPFL